LYFNNKNYNLNIKINKFFQINMTVQIKKINSHNFHKSKIKILKIFFKKEFKKIY